MIDATTQRSDRPFSGLSEAFSLGNDRLFVAIALLSVVPLWFGSYLPLVDLPQHAGQVAALDGLWSGNEQLEQLFRINWFTPYLLGYLLLYALDLVMPITTATQLLVSVSVVAIPLLTGPLLRAVGADERWKWLAIPCSYGFAVYWGFLSFLVAAPLALVFLILTVRFVTEPNVKRGIGIAAFALFLFFCHIIVLGFACLVALGYVWGASYRDVRSLVLRTLPYVAPVPIIVVWMVVTYSTEAQLQTNSITFGPVMYRVLQLIVQPSGREDLSLSLITVLAVSGCVWLLPWFSGARFSTRPERVLPFVFGLGVFLLAPHYVFGNAYFYQRLGVFLVPLWLMLWDAPVRTRYIERVAIAVVIFWVAATIGRFAAFARETETFDSVVTRMEPGRRVAAMIYDNASPLFALPVYLHFAQWYQATRGGIVDFNFADFYSQMVRYRADAGPRIDETLGWYPTVFQWDAYGGERYDYFIVKASIDVSAEIFKEKLDSVELVANDGWWWVYRNLERVGVEN